MEDIFNTDAEIKIRDLISGTDFKNPDINFDAIVEQVKAITGCIPSVKPTWKTFQTANEELALDGSNKITEKITEIEIVYLVDDKPKSLKFHV